MASGQIQTVLGDIEPSALGRTLTHEHIKMDYKCCIQPPWRASDAEKMVNSEINLANLGWIQHNPYSHKLNLSLGDEPFDDMVKELNLFKQEGGVFWKFSGVFLSIQLSHFVKIDFPSSAFHSRS